MRETTAEPTTVLVVDDQTLVRAGFRLVLDRSDDIKVVGEASDGIQAVRLARELQPDVVLMDIQMPRMDGIEATRSIVTDRPQGWPRVIVLTTFELDDYIVEALRAGASGFLLKDTDPAELRQAVQVVAAGEALLSPNVTRRVISTFVDQSPGPKRDPRILDVLTDREREVVELVARGMSNHEISECLFISPATAKTHVSRAIMKVGARDRAQLVVLAYETGLVTP